MSLNIITQLAGISEDSKLHDLQALRAQATDNSELSYQALFVDADVTGVSQAERYAVATFVAGLHGEETVKAHYRTLLAAESEPGILGVIEALSIISAKPGPYGRYPDGTNLFEEDESGPAPEISQSYRDLIGPRLTAALEHAHMLVLYPREAGTTHLERLVARGWTNAQIVTLSQLVAFLTYQIRAIVGFAALEEAGL